MRRFDQTSARLRVFTFKEGALSMVAHDLELEVGRFTVEVDDASGAISARISATSLRVLHALSGGAPSPHAPSENDKRDIEKNLATDVLEVARFPEIAFVGRAEAGTVRGTLTLHGVARELVFAYAKRGSELVTEVTLHQPDFGIRPYRALLGALKVKADVVVKAALPSA